MILFSNIQYIQLMNIWFDKILVNLEELSIKIALCMLSFLLSQEN